MKSLDKQIDERLRQLEERRDRLVAEIRERQEKLESVVDELGALRNLFRWDDPIPEQMPDLSRPKRRASLGVARLSDDVAPGEIRAVIARRLARERRDFAGLLVGSTGYHAAILLLANGRPMHVRALAAQLNAAGHDVKEHTVAVTLGRLARDKRVISHEDRNTFGLLAWHGADATGAAKGLAKPPTAKKANQRADIAAAGRPGRAPRKGTAKPPAGKAKAPSGEAKRGPGRPPKKPRSRVR